MIHGACTGHRYSNNRKSIRLRTPDAIIGKGHLGQGVQLFTVRCTVQNEVFGVSNLVLRTGNTLDQDYRCSSASYFLGAASGRIPPRASEKSFQYWEKISTLSPETVWKGRVYRSSPCSAFRVEVLSFAQEARKPSSCRNSGRDTCLLPTELAYLNSATTSFPIGAV